MAGMRLRFVNLVLRWLLMPIIAAILLPAAGSAAAITTPTANKTTVGKYDLYELTFNLTDVSPSDYNPFRPDTTADSLSPAGVDVWAEVTTPSGTVKKVWGYWDIDYTYLGNCTKATQELHDRFVPTSAPHWHVRYAPMEVGSYKVTVKATDQSGTTSSSELSFVCVDSNLKGFVKVSADGSRLVYSDGSPFIQFGTMLPYGTQYVGPAMDLMKSNGMNFIRKWLVNRELDDIHRDLEGWASYTADTSTFRTGLRSASKVITGTGTLVDQSFIGCKPSTYYKAYVYFKTSSTFNGSVAVNVNEDGTNVSQVSRTGNSVSGPNQNWVLSQVVFKTGSVAEMLHFKPKIVSGSAGTVWTDDAGLYECDSSGNTIVDYNMVFNPSFESWTPARLRTIPLARMEYALQKAQDDGVMVQACIFDYRLWNASNPTGFYTPYYGDWFTSVSSIAQQERVLRYLIARFGSYRSLFAWELTNEMDSSYTDTRGSWIAGRASMIHGGDPYGHPVTNSYWGSPADSQYGQISALDINQVHYYLDTEEYTSTRGYPSWWNLPSGMVVDTNPANAASGNCSLKATANGNTISVSPGIYCKPNRSFTLRYKVKTSGVSGQASVLIQFYGGSSPGANITLNNTGTSSGYTQRTQTFTTGSTCSNYEIVVQLTGSSGTAWFDDFELVDNTTGRQAMTDGGLESPLLGEDEFDWAVYNTVNTRQRYNSGPDGADKVWVSGESGLMGANYNLSNWAVVGDTTKPRHDSSGLHLHNEIWAQLVVSGALNTPTYWWVDEYIRPRGLYGVWKGPTTFASNLPFYSGGQGVSTDPCVSDVKVTVSDPKLRLAGQKNATKGYFWIQNKDNTWAKVIRDGVNPSAVTGTISIPGFTDGVYSLSWYDTNTGQVVRTETRSTTAGALTLSVSSLTTDTAVIVQSVGAASSPATDSTLAVDKPMATPGETITYTVTYTNKGSGDATNVTVTLPIPASTTYTSGSASDGGTYNALTNSVKWVIPTLAAGASGKCTAQAKVN